LLFALPLLLCACGETTGGVYYNGRELSDSEIEALMYRETETDTETETAPETETEPPIPEYTLVAFDGTKPSPTEESVFWTKSGDVYHTDALCRHILSTKEVFYGTAAEAVSEGKERVCSACIKENKTEDE